MVSVPEFSNELSISYSIGYSTNTVLLYFVLLGQIAQTSLVVDMATDNWPLDSIVYFGSIRVRQLAFWNRIIPCGTWFCPGVNRYRQDLPGWRFVGIRRWVLKHIVAWWRLMVTEIWAALAQVMAWCLTAPSHYLNQCWFTSQWAGEAQWQPPEGNFPKIYSYLSHQTL